LKKADWQVSGATLKILINGKYKQAVINGNGAN
jgi:hypothetical protein